MTTVTFVDNTLPKQLDIDVFPVEIAPKFVKCLMCEDSPNPIFSLVKRLHNVLAPRRLPYDGSFLFLSYGIGVTPEHFASVASSRIRCRVRVRLGRDPQTLQQTLRLAASGLPTSA